MLLLDEAFTQLSSSFLFSTLPSCTWASATTIGLLFARNRRGKKTCVQVVNNHFPTGLHNNFAHLHKGKVKLPTFMLINHRIMRTSEAIRAPRRIGRVPAHIKQRINITANTHLPCIDSSITIEEIGCLLKIVGEENYLPSLLPLPTHPMCTTGLGIKRLGTHDPPRRRKPLLLRFTHNDTSLDQRHRQPRCNLALGRLTRLSLNYMISNN